MPLRDTVAGDAFAMLSTSKTILQLSLSGMWSPFGSVSVRLLTSSVLRCSVQTGSIGPSNTSHTCSASATADNYRLNTLSGIKNIPDSVLSIHVVCTVAYALGLYTQYTHKIINWLNVKRKHDGSQWLYTSRSTLFHPPELTRLCNDQL